MPNEREEALEDREELNAHQAASQAASEVAADRAYADRGRLLEQLSDPGVFRGEDKPLEDEIGIDFARPHILAQKEEEDVWRHRWLNENEGDRIVHEHNPGRLCKGPFLELAQGVNDSPHEARKPLTDAGKRKTREAMDAKTAYQSMGKRGRTFKGLTEIVTTSKVERDENSDDRGRLGKVRDKLFG